MRKLFSLPIMIVIPMLALIAPAITAADHGTGTPAELVAAYDALADSILAVQQTERHMVKSILATTYGHAQATYATIKRKLKAGEDVSAEVEKLADLVSQLGNEGDAAVGAIRKRLVEGGHHHNAKGEKDGVYDEGFVVITRKAKKALLDAAGNVGKLGGSISVAKLDAEWSFIAEQYHTAMKGD